MNFIFGPPPPPPNMSTTAWKSPSACSARPIGGSPHVYGNELRLCKTCLLRVKPCRAEIKVSKSASLGPSPLASAQRCHNKRHKHAHIFNCGAKKKLTASASASFAKEIEHGFQLGFDIVSYVGSRGWRLRCRCRRAVVRISCRSGHKPTVPKRRAFSLPSVGLG